MALSGAERNRRWRERNPECARESNRRSREKLLESNPDYFREYAASRRADQANADRKHYAKLRDAVFDHYGRSCACCGSEKRLSIDHIAGDGQNHRDQLFGPHKAGHSRRMYQWLVANGFPAGYQTLCLPCNQSKGAGERCQLSHARSQLFAG